MNKFKTKLIHLLGGSTPKDVKDQVRLVLRIASKPIVYHSAHLAMEALEEEARKLNGTPAEEWCSTIWDRILTGKESTLLEAKIAYNEYRPILDEFFPKIKECIDECLSKQEASAAPSPEASAAPDSEASPAPVPEASASAPNAPAPDTTPSLD